MQFTAHYGWFGLALLLLFAMCMLPLFPLMYLDYDQGRSIWGDAEGDDVRADLVRSLSLRVNWDDVIPGHAVGAMWQSKLVHVWDWTKQQQWTRVGIYGVLIGCKQHACLRNGDRVVCASRFHNQVLAFEIGADLVFQTIVTRNDSAQPWSIDASWIHGYQEGVEPCARYMALRCLMYCLSREYPI